MSKIKKIVILCGGTGGHFYPGMTVARRFTERGGNVELFLTGKHAGKQAELAEKYGIESTIMPKMPPPVGILGKILFTLSLLKSVFASLKALRKEKPDAVLGMGSFTSFPAAVAAKLMWIPLFLHDGNARVGKANIFLSRWAKTTMLSFPAVNKEKILSPTVLTGMPLRPELHTDTFRRKTRKSLVEEFNKKFHADFKIRPKIILVFGGSQGASVFNNVFPEKVTNRKIQVIHIAGRGNDAEVQIRYKNAEFAYKVIDATEEMSLLYSLAELIFCRGGGSTVAELALFAKYAVLIPYPYATDDHQSDNINYYIASGAGIKLREEESTPEKFAEIIDAFMAEPKKYITDGLKSAILAKPEATDTILKTMNADL